MRTPAGTECSFYYADFHRGRSKQSCRLIERNPQSRPWRPSLCQTCPVPRLQLTNTCPNLVLEGRVDSAWLGLSRRVAVTAFCVKSAAAVAAPQIGCGRCHEFRVAQVVPKVD